MRHPSSKAWRPGLLTLDLAISKISIASPDRPAGSTGLIKGASAFRMMTGTLGGSTCADERIANSLEAAT